MTNRAVAVDVSFLDAAERTAVVRYVLEEEYDDTGFDLTDVAGAAEDLITALNVLTWDEITSYNLVILMDDLGGASANVAANNQIRAFTRCLDASGRKTGFEVPAWDDAVFDQDDANLLSAAYNTAAAAVAALLRNPDPDEYDPMASVEWSQSRTRKSRNVRS